MKRIPLIILAMFVCLSLAAGPAYAGLEELDVFEPNNSLDEAKEAELNKMNVVFISPGGDIDCFKIHADVEGYLDVKLFNVPKELKLVLNFYDSARKPIKKKPPISVREGDYYLEIKEANGKSKDTPFFLVINFIKGIDAFEPNDSVSEAKEITPGELYKITLMPEKDKDYFKIDVKKPGYVIPHLQEKHDSTGFCFNIYNNNGERLAWSFKEQQVEKGTYYISLENLSWNSATPLYFKVDLVESADALLPSHKRSEARPVTIGESYKVITSSEGEDSWFEIEVDEPGKLLILVSEAKELTGVFVNTGINFYIWNQDEEIIGNMNDDRSDVKRFVYLKEKGIYHIQMERYSLNTKKIIPFNLYFDFLPDSEVGTSKIEDGPLSVYVVGFDSKDNENSKVEGELLARAGKGKFILTRDEEELSNALSKISKEIKHRKAAGPATTSSKLWFILAGLFLILIIAFLAKTFSKKKP